MWFDNTCIRNCSKQSAKKSWEIKHYSASFTNKSTHCRSSSKRASCCEIAFSGGGFPAVSNKNTNTDRMHFLFMLASAKCVYLCSLLCCLPAHTHTHSLAVGGARDQQDKRRWRRRGSTHRKKSTEQEPNTNTSERADGRCCFDWWGGILASATGIRSCCAREERGWEKQKHTGLPC